MVSSDRSEALVPGPSGGSNFAVTDGQSVYYVGPNGILWKVSVTGGAPVELFNFASPNNYSLSAPMAVDDTSVYLVAAAGQSIVKIAK